MSMKRGYCIKCRYDDPKRHIFPVNSEAEVCYCPKCMAEYKPKDAIAHYNHFMKHFILKADASLHIAMMPDVSYQKYADVLEIEESNIQALLGRSLSLLYLSTLRHTTFKQVVNLNELDENRYHLVSNRHDYFSFLRAAEKVSNDYEEKMHKRLTFKGYFHDKDCVKLYISRLGELIAFKQYIVAELKEIDKVQEADYIEKGIHALEGKIGGKFVTADGDVTVYRGTDRFNSPQLVTLPEKIKTGLDKYRGYTLKEDDRKLIVIKDVIFKSNRAAYGLASMGYYMGITFGIIAAALATFSFFFIRKMPWLFILLISFAGAFLLTGSILMFAQYKLKQSLKKKHL